MVHGEGVSVPRYAWDIKHGCGTVSLGLFSLTFLHCFATELLVKLHDALGSADVTLHKKMYSA